MNKKFLLLAIIVVFATSCGVIQPLNPPESARYQNNYGSYTATSIESIQIKSTQTNWSNYFEAKDLPCQSVVQCWNLDHTPFSQTFQNGSQLYVWKNASLGVTTFYIVINRPSLLSWDHIGLQNYSGQWEVGVYSGYWIKTSLNFDFPIAIGMVNEPWAVIVSTADSVNFYFEIVPNYDWN